MIQISKKLLFIITVFLLSCTMNLLAQDEKPKCHVYIDSYGWTAGDINKLVKVQYSSTDICNELLTGYVCFSYYEDKEKCTKNDKSLIDLFIKDAKSSGELID